MEQDDVSDYTHKYIIAGDTLAPLLRLPGLQSIYVESPWIELDRAFLQTCVSTFKRLKTLHVSPEQPTASSAYVPMDALIDFAELSTELTRLTLYVDAMHLPPLPLAPRSTSSLKWLNVCDSMIKDPVAVAEYLKTLFPALETVTYGFFRQEALRGGPSNPRQDYLNAWQKVTRLLPDDDCCDSETESELDAQVRSDPVD